MEKEFAPFYSGQEVICITDKSDIVHKGQKYIVSDCYNKCGHGWSLELEGIMSPIFYPCKCRICGTKHPIIKGQPFPLDPNLFRAIAPALKAVTFEKITEDHPVFSN